MVAPPNLTKLANNFGSDKGDSVFHAHAYTRLYAFLFDTFREDTFSMLEFGLQRGCIDPNDLRARIGADAPSARMWLSYFPNAHLFGFDISDFSHLKIDRFTFFKGDMGHQPDIDLLKAATPKFRVIVDDASHAAYHQQFAFANLFDRVESGGFYVIEDLHVRPPFDQVLPATRATIDVFEEYSRTGRLTISGFSPSYCSLLSECISGMFVHRDDKGGVNTFVPKLIVLQKK